MNLGTVRTTRFLAGTPLCQGIYIVVNIYS
jgi:hypothetical protein